MATAIPCAAWVLPAIEVGVPAPHKCKQAACSRGKGPSPGQGSRLCRKPSSHSCYLSTPFGKMLSFAVTWGADSSQVHPKDE